MIIVGAKGMAKELLEIFSIEKKMPDDEIVFFDNMNASLHRLYDRFQVLKNFDEVEEYFGKVSNEFTIGIGNPILRRKMAEKFIGLGGEMKSIISTRASIGNFNTFLGKGSQLMQGVIVTNDVKIGEGVLININSTISHDTIIGDYSEIACGVTIPGRCAIGENVFVGSKAVFNPDITVGRNSIIGSGTVVIENVPASVTVAGNPAKIIKHHG